jgi:hypothetical protein
MFKINELTSHFRNTKTGDVIVKDWMLQCTTNIPHYESSKRIAKARFQADQKASA